MAAEVVKSLQTELVEARKQIESLRGTVAKSEGIRADLTATKEHLAALRWDLASTEKHASQKSDRLSGKLDRLEVNPKAITPC